MAEEEGKETTKNSPPPTQAGESCVGGEKSAKALCENFVFRVPPLPPHFNQSSTQRYVRKSFSFVIYTR